MEKNAINSEKNKEKICIIIFIWSAFLFFLNLQYNFSESNKIIFFWSSVLFMLGIIIYQIFLLKNNKFILFEIFIFFFLLHLVYQLGYYGLRGTDSYVDYNFYKVILNDHQFVLGQDMINGWPLLHIFSSIMSILTDIDSLLIAKILPSIITSLIVFPIYLLTQNIYDDKKVALFTCLLFGTIPRFANFEALFVRETFGIFFFIFLFFILYFSRTRKDFRFKLLCIILIPVIVLSHHFSSFMFIIFLIIYIIVDKTIPYIFRKNEKIKNHKIHIITFTIFILVILFSYWAYFTNYILNSFRFLFFDIFSIAQFTPYAERIGLSAQIITLRGNIIYYGFFFFLIILSLILLIKFIVIRNEQKIEDTSFTFYLFFCLFMGALSLFFLGSLIYPDRFLPFGWMLGFIPIVGLLINLNKNSYKKIIILILISFIIFNIYNIEPDYYTGHTSQQGVVGTEKEYSIAQTINVSKAYYGYVGIYGPIYDIQGVEFNNRKVKDILTNFNFPNSSNIAIINNDLFNNLEIIRTKSSTYYNTTIKILSYKNFNDVAKICDVGKIYVIYWQGIK